MGHSTSSGRNTGRLSEELTAAERAAGVRMATPEEEDRFNQLMDELERGEQTERQQRANQRVYTIVMSRPGRRDIEHTGTLEELIEAFGYTLERGASYQNERGRRKINRNPKTIQSLLTNIQNADDNAAANGYSGRTYSFRKGR